MVLWTILEVGAVIDHMQYYEALNLLLDAFLPHQQQPHIPSIQKMACHLHQLVSVVPAFIGFVLQPMFQMPSQ